MKMNVVSYYETARPTFPEDRYFNERRREDLKSYLELQYFHKVLSLISEDVNVKSFLCLNAIV